jgi:ribonucleoside-diphosphate reductase alpha chain
MPEELSKILAATEAFSVSKRSQALSAAGDVDTAVERIPFAESAQQQEFLVPSQRRRLPDERKSITHEFSVGDHEGYLTVGMYDDGMPGEIFIKMAQEGSMLSGLMDGLAVLISIGLQYGVPLKVIVDKLTNTRFEPSGSSQNPDICYASSVLDYIARWLGGTFISSDYLKTSPR